MARTSSWKAYLVVCGFVALLTFFMLEGVGLPSVNRGFSINQQGGKGHFEAPLDKEVTSSKTLTPSYDVMRAALEELRSSTKLLPSEIRLAFRMEIAPVLREEVRRVLSEGNPLLDPGLELTLARNPEADPLLHPGFERKPELNPEEPNPENILTAFRAEFVSSLREEVRRALVEVNPGLGRDPETPKPGNPNPENPSQEDGRARSKLGDANPDSLKPGSDSRKLASDSWQRNSDSWQPGSDRLKPDLDKTSGSGRSDHETKTRLKGGQRGRVELTAEEAAWAAKPDSFCFGKGGRITVLTVTPGLEKHIDESEMKERGTVSRLSKVYLEKMRRNRLLYIKRHGYEYCELQSKSDPTRHPSWSKIPITMQLLQTSPAVFQIDADAIFVDMKKPIETMLEQSNASHAELVYTNDHDSDVANNHSPINCGVYFVRASDWARSFSERVYTDYPGAVDHEWWEQRAVRDFRDEHFEEWDQHACIIPHWRMNSRLDWYKYGEFIAHGAMSPKPYRFQQLLKYMLIADPEEEGWWASISLGQYD